MDGRALGVNTRSHNFSIFAFSTTFGTFVCRLGEAWWLGGLVYLVDENLSSSSSTRVYYIFICRYLSLYVAM